MFPPALLLPPPRPFSHYHTRHDISGHAHPAPTRDTRQGLQLSSLAEEVASTLNEYGFPRYEFGTAVCRASCQVRRDARRVLYEDNAFVSITTNRAESRDYTERFGISFYFGDLPQTLKCPLRCHVQFQEETAPMAPEPLDRLMSTPTPWPVESWEADRDFLILTRDLELFTRILRCFDLSSTFYSPLTATQLPHQACGLQYLIRLKRAPAVSCNL